jgi:hydrogenase expression/formation protein HypD
MKFIDEYRDPKLFDGLLSRVKKRAERLSRPITIMEVCGSHTNAIGRFGIRSLLPDTIRLISGPGCPVCVTSIQDVDAALFLARQPGVVFATFGDMLRVPGTGRRSLELERADGADVRVVDSALECLALARDNSDRRVVFMGIGFETTSPAAASVVKTARDRGITNLAVFSVHKVIPPAIGALLSDPQISVDGFMLPGHVSTILGTAAYRPIPERGRAGVITGFEPVDILEGIMMIQDQIITGNVTVEIQYGRAVKEEGNRAALRILDEVFEPADCAWRGLGTIPESGLVFRNGFREFDAASRFEIPAVQSHDTPGCRCGDVLKGIISPPECPLFRTACFPRNPLGPCMVSAEGTCAAYYKYHQ